jgi:hypothetical protein
VDGPVDPTAAGQPGVGCVHDGVHLLLRDVTKDGFDDHFPPPYAAASPSILARIEDEVIAARNDAAPAGANGQALRTVDRTLGAAQGDAWERA